MFRYVCENPTCLSTFLSPNLDIFKKCDLCGDGLIHVGKPDKEENIEYPPIETIEELKDKYLKLREKAIRIGLLESECLTVGRAFRKLTFEERKRLLQENGLWKEGVIYKHVMMHGLLKMVIDEKAMDYHKRRMNENGN